MRTIRGAFTAHRALAIGCASVLLTTGAGAAVYAQVHGAPTLTAADGLEASPALSGTSGSAATPTAAPTKTATAKSSGAESQEEPNPLITQSIAKLAERDSATPDATQTATATAKSSGSGSSSAKVSNPLAGEAFSGVPQVGTLFGTSNGSLTSHHCTGSVVSTPEGDIVVTAAHCVYGSSGLAFVPEYDNGSKPYGIWNVSAVYVAPEWVSNQNPDYDVAFIVVHKSSSNAKIQDVVGSDTIAINQSYTSLTTVIGYPSSTDAPITCTNYTTEFSSTQLQWDCADYPGGTSGSPFLTDVDTKTGLGEVDGVIGGYETGGDSPDVSYSVRFTDWTADLLAQAEKGQ